MAPPKKYKPNFLKARIAEYFECGGKLFKYSVGSGNRCTILEERLYSIYGTDGLIKFLDINKSTWERYKEDEEFAEIIKNAIDDIYEHRYTLAAIGAIDSSLVIFDLKCNRDWSEKDKRDQSASATPVAVTIQLADTSGGKKGEENGE
jgi:hypothetical protein